ncbi:MAG TPA: hypothetical protein PKE47_02300 [Verrucomicrobiota bacterium]|nr:hypothetical protein [Verrucomicrobiota bacterium]
MSDLKTYAQAHAPFGRESRMTVAWFRRVSLNAAAAGRYSGRRTGAECACGIWQAGPWPVA